MAMRIIPIALVISYQKTSKGPKLWMQKRVTQDEFKNLLEFPGGKIESLETPIQAAIREFREEVGVELEEKKLIFFNMYEEELADKRVQLFCFLFHDVNLQLDEKGYVLLAEGQVSLNEEFLAQIPYSNQKILQDFINLVEI